MVERFSSASRARFVVEISNGRLDEKQAFDPKDSFDNADMFFYFFGNAFITCGIEYTAINLN